jgi:hypothetical protein
MLSGTQCCGSKSESGSKSGSGYNSQTYGSESGSFYHQAKIIYIKTFIPTVWSLLSLLYDFLSLKIDVNVPLKSNKQKNFLKKFADVVKFTDENNRIQIH